MANLVDMLGGYGPGALDQRRALERQMGAQAQPYTEAVNEATRRARGNAATVAQGSGNPFLAMREASMQANRAAAPLVAQRAAAESGIVRDQIMREQARREADQQKFERYLGAGLQGVATGAGALLQGFGGPGAGQPGGMPPTSAVQPQAPQQMPNMAGMATAPVIAPRPSGSGPTNPNAPGLEGLTDYSAWATRSMANPATQPVTAGSGGFAQGGSAQPNGLADLLQRGGGLASMFPGYGTLAGFGLGGLGALMRG